MQAAQLTSPTVLGQAGLRDAAAHSPTVALAALVVLDDPQEWAAFSRPCGEKTHSGDQAAATAGLWESQVVVRGMHCAACSLTLEQALLGVKGASHGCSPSCA